MDNAETIFISHATPADNQFTLWLALRLMALGYAVWCDLLKLSKVEIEYLLKKCPTLTAAQKSLMDGAFTTNHA